MSAPLFSRAYGDDANVAWRNTIKASMFSDNAHKASPSPKLPVFAASPFEKKHDISLGSTRKAVATAFAASTQEGARLRDSFAAWGTVRPFAVGGMAACTATCCVQPIDMVKVRIQLMGEGGAKVNANPVSVARKLIAEEGFMFLYKGLSAGLLRQLTYGMTRLGVFRTLTNKFKPKDGSALPFSTRLMCSLTAGGIGALIGTPADAALVRMQGDSTLPIEQRRNYKNAIDALLRMAREEGMSGFFSGASPTIYRGLAINVGMLSTYDGYKKYFANKFGGEGALTTFVAGGLSGWTAATVSLPFDFIKTRLQRQTPGADGKLPYKNFFDCVKKVAAKEGPLAFYNGYGTFVVRITPHILLTWCFMEVLNNVNFLK